MDQENNIKNKGELFLKKGEIFSIILFLIMGIALLVCSVNPPKILVFLNGNAWRVGSAIIGAFFLIAGLSNMFHRKK